MDRKEYTKKRAALFKEYWEKCLPHFDSFVKKLMIDPPHGSPKHCLEYLNATEQFYKDFKATIKEWGCGGFEFGEAD